MAGYDPSLRLRGLPLDDDHRALTVQHFDGETTGAIVCVLDRALRCAESSLTAVARVVRPTAQGWLVSAHQSGMRWGTAYLTHLEVQGDTLSIDSLEVGGVDGYGEGCEPPHDGYCVWMSGRAMPTTFVTGDCVERRQQETWKATHVGIGDLWIDEVVTPREGGPCIERFRISTGLTPAECGPPSPTPLCPVED